MSEPIVCGLDGEPHSLRALQAANELAMRSGRRLELLHITSAFGEPARRDRQERLLCALRSDLGRADLPLLMGTGAPAHELTCASRRAALVVLGTRGPSTLRQVARGSVSVAVMLGAPASVGGDVGPRDDLGPAKQVQVPGRPGDCATGQRASDRVSRVRASWCSRVA